VSRVLLIVAHGSRLQGANAHLLELAQRVQARTQEFEVRVAHVELAEPSIETALLACAEEGVAEVVIHPLFLSPGRHLTQDIPERVEALARQHPSLTIRITPALGNLPGMVDLILSAL
jgi:sirohydrochlorin ferrochelatase